MGCQQPSSPQVERSRRWQQVKRKGWLLLLPLLLSRACTVLQLGCLLCPVSCFVAPRSQLVAPVAVWAWHASSKMAPALCRVLMHHPFLAPSSLPDTLLWTHHDTGGESSELSSPSPMSRMGSARAAAAAAAAAVAASAGHASYQDGWRGAGDGSGDVPHPASPTRPFPPPAATPAATAAAAAAAAAVMGGTSQGDEWPQGAGGSGSGESASFAQGGGGLRAGSARVRSARPGSGFAPIGGSFAGPSTTHAGSSGSSSGGGGLASGNPAVSGPSASAGMWAQRVGQGGVQGAGEEGPSGLSGALEAAAAANSARPQGAPPGGTRMVQSARPVTRGGEIDPSVWRDYINVQVGSLQEIGDFEGRSTRPSTP